MRSKSAHDAVCDTVPQYTGVHYHNGAVVPYAARTTREAQEWTRQTRRRSVQQEHFYAALMPFIWHLQRRAATATGMTLAGNLSIYIIIYIHI